MRPPRDDRRRALRGTALAALLTGALAAPAGAAVPAGSVATVGDTAVTQASYDHWARVAARSAKIAVVPKPPRYARCVARKKGSKAGRKRRCAAEFRRLRGEVMAFVLTARWVELESAERAIAVSPEEVEAEFAKQRDATFATDAAFLDYKDDTGLTDADIRFKIRLSLLSSRVRDKVLEESGATSNQQQVLADFDAAYRAKWIARTACARVYRTRDCRS